MKFHSVEQAIRYAYRISERVEYARTDPNSVRGTSSEAMTPLDLHAQAAMIMSAISRLHPVERDSINAMYANGEVRAAAIRNTVEYLMPSMSGALPGAREAQIVMLHWVAKNPSIRKIAEDAGVSYRQVCNWRRALLRVWLPVHIRATERLQSRLFGDGGFELAA